MGIVIAPAAEITVLHVGWPVYEALAAEAGDTGHSRIAYDGELLEIMSPSRKHEMYNRLLEALIREICRVRKIDLLASGSTTFKAKPRGAEPDSSFYIGEQAEHMRLRDAGDSSAEPPPDIVIEIDLSRERIDKMALYAALGAREFWRYDGARLRAFALQTVGFPEQEHSAVLAGIPIAVVDRFLRAGVKTNHTEWLDSWNDWLRNNHDGGALGT